MPKGKRRYGDKGLQAKGRGRTRREESEGGSLRTIAWVLAWALLIAARCSMRGERVQLATFGSASGLANMNVKALLEDRTGGVWVGTESGVYRADGQRFVKHKAFTEAGLDMIHALGEDAAGRVWAIGERHLVFWDGTAVHTIQDFDGRKSSSEADTFMALPGVPDAVLLLRDGALLRVGSADHGRSWTVSNALSLSLRERHPELQTLTSIAMEGGPTVWASCGMMLCHIDLIAGTVESFGERDGIPAALWRKLLVARDGTVWARSTGAIVSRRKGASHFLISPELPAKGSPEVDTPLLAEDPAGTIVVNAGEGLAFLTEHGWRVYDRSNGLPEAEEDALLFDHAGNLWLGPQGLGLARWLGYGVWQGWTKGEGLSSNVLWSSLRDKSGAVWALTSKGFDRMDPGTERFQPVTSSLPLTHLRVIRTDAREHLWLGDSLGEVIDFDPRTGAARVAATQLGRVMDMMVDRHQRVWVCAKQGLRVFLPEEAWRTAHALGEQALPAGFAWSISEDRAGTIWLTNGQGLYRLDGEVWSRVQLPFPGGMEHAFLLTPAADGTLWAQSKQPFPMLRLRVVGDPATGYRAEIVERVVGADFGSDNITFMRTDRRGWLWVGSDDGIHVYNGAQWVQATAEDGLTWDDTDFQAFFADGDGSVWIGTSGGLSHLLHPERLFSQPPPVVRLTDAHVGEQELGSGNPAFDLRRPALSVSLLNTEYGRGSAVIYRYRFEGQEDEWREKRGGSWRFPALEPKHYRLSVVAYDTRLHRSSDPVSLSFRVLEPWWRRPWFRVVETLCILLLGLLAWRVSVHLLVRRQEMLEKLVATRTRELQREKVELLTTRSALLEMTQRDALTGLLNRGAIFTRMRALCEESQENGRPLAVAMADLDSFKRINDQHGHLAGDHVLRECARRMEAAMRMGDAVGRYGGEEMLILLPALQPANAEARMEQMRLAVAGTPIVHGELSLTVTCSFGVAWLGDGDCSVDTLVAAADAALYVAKRNGRDRVEFASLTLNERDVAS